VRFRARRFSTIGAGIAMLLLDKTAKELICSFLRAVNNQIALFYTLLLFWILFQTKPIHLRK
jgi:hypothetical protein